MKMSREKREESRPISIILENRHMLLGLLALLSFLPTYGLKIKTENSPELTLTFYTETDLSLAFPIVIYKYIVFRFSTIYQYYVHFQEHIFLT